MKNDLPTTENMRETIAKQEMRIAELEALVKFFEEQFRLAKHKQFGASSEKSEYDQLSLFNETEATADANVLEPELTEVRRHYRKQTRLVTDRLPEDLPVRSRGT